MRPLARLAPLALLTLTAPNGCVEGGPFPGAPRPVTQYDAATLYNTISVYGSSFSSDESALLVSSDETGVFNVYRQSLDGDQRVPLTQSDSSATFAVSYFPHDDRFLHQADQGGNELTHIYVRELDGTEIDLTPGEDTRASFAGWNHDLDAFYVQSNRRDPRYMDLYRYRFPEARANGPSGEYPFELVYENLDGSQPGRVSDDERWLVLTKTRNNADNDLFLLDLTRPGGTPIHVTPHDGDVNHRATDFSPDSTKLYFTSNQDSEFQRVWEYDIATGDREVVYEDDWDVTAYDFSWNGRYLRISVNDDASTRLKVIDTATGEPLALPDMPAGVVTQASFSRSGEKLVLGVNGDTSPTNLYLLEVGSGELTKLTDTLNPMVEQGDLVESSVVRYPSFDGLEIPALLFKPHTATADQPVPAVVLVHGGPGGQTRRGYRADIQFLVNHGYAVLAVNNRGSSGYGKTFYHLDDRRHGEDDLKDCIFGRRYLETLDWVDGSQVAIMGGSYGGYMVAAALAFTPDAFDAGINIFGVTNWLRTLESIPPWWEAQREALYAELGDPAVDRERLHRISPLFHASNIQRPLLVVQGANDPRVLQVESDELVAAARANGVEVEYILFPDEGHGFRNRKNRITAAQAYLDFLDRHLKGEPPAP